MRKGGADALNLGQAITDIGVLSFFLFYVISDIKEILSRDSIKIIC